MKLKNLILNIYVQHREPRPLLFYERKQLADFFIAVMDLRPKDNEINNEAKKQEIS